MYLPTCAARSHTDWLRAIPRFGGADTGGKSTIRQGNCEGASQASLHLVNRRRCPRTESTGYRIVSSGQYI
jgi:hypothetical protein